MLNLVVKMTQTLAGSTVVQINRHTSMFHGVDIPARRVRRETDVLKGHTAETDQLRHLWNMFSRGRIGVVRIAQGIQPQMTDAEKEIPVDQDARCSQSLG